MPDRMADLVGEQIIAQMIGQMANQMIGQIADHMAKQMADQKAYQIKHGRSRGTLYFYSIEKYL